MDDTNVKMSKLMLVNESEEAATELTNVVYDTMANGETN